MRVSIISSPLQSPLIFWQLAIYRYGSFERYSTLLHHFWSRLIFCLLQVQTTPDAPARSMTPTSALQSDIVHTATTAQATRFPEASLVAQSTSDFAAINALDSTSADSNGSSMYIESLRSSNSPADTPVTDFFCGIPIRRSLLCNQSPEPVRKENTPPNRVSAAEDSCAQTSAVYSAISVPDPLPSAILTRMSSPISQTESRPLQHPEVIGCLPTKASSVPPTISEIESSSSAGEQTDSSHRDLPKLRGQLCI